MSSFALKILACISMLFDHTGYLIFNSSSFFNYIGRLAFPIFAFQIAEGYTHTKDLKKYVFRLFLCAIISQIPFMFFTKLIFNKIIINVLFTLLFGLFSIIIYDKYNKYLGVLFAIIFAYFAKVFSFDYGIYGILVILLFYVFKGKPLFMAIAFIIATYLKYVFSIIPFGFNTLFYVFTSFNSISIDFFATSITIIPILLYNGKKGKDIKYFLYLFYPLHLLIISVIYYIVY